MSSQNHPKFTAGRCFSVIRTARKVTGKNGGNSASANLSIKNATRVSLISLLYAFPNIFNNASCTFGLTQTGVFGVPVVTSSRYANVPFLGLRKNGKTYLSGYILTVVSKTALFLREKGRFISNIFYSWILLLAIVELAATNSLLLDNFMAVFL